MIDFEYEHVKKKMLYREQAATEVEARTQLLNTWHGLEACDVALTRIIVDGCVIFDVNALVKLLGRRREVKHGSTGSEVARKN